jgi:hypothetical protein
MTDAGDLLITVGEPNWAPLEYVLTREECAAYMYMGRAGHLELYKHHETRRYLNISADGSSFYLYREGRYVEVTRSVALEHAHH